MNSLHNLNLFCYHLTCKNRAWVEVTYMIPLLVCLLMYWIVQASLSLREYSGTCQGKYQLAIHICIYLWKYTQAMIYFISLNMSRNLLPDNYYFLHSYKSKHILNLDFLLHFHIGYCLEIFFFPFFLFSDLLLYIDFNIFVVLLYL